MTLAFLNMHETRVESTYGPSVVLGRVRKVNQIPWRQMLIKEPVFNNRATTYHDARSKPNNSRKEAEGLSSFPLAAHRLTPSAEMPGENATTVVSFNGVNKNTKGSKPSERYNDVH